MLLKCSLYFFISPPPPHFLIKMKTHFCLKASVLPVLALGSPGFSTAGRQRGLGDAGGQQRRQRAPLGLLKSLVTCAPGVQREGSVAWWQGWTSLSPSHAEEFGRPFGSSGAVPRHSLRCGWQHPAALGERLIINLFFFFTLSENC